MVALGEFQVLGEIARGGSGAVLRARAPDGQLVALKVFHAGQPLEGVARRRFERECAAVLRLEHPNLVRARAAGWERGSAFLVLDLVEGEDLERHLQRRGPLPPREVARLGAALARGLAHAHAQGVVHRDVKPANVLLRADGEPVLVDFGLAKELDLSQSRLTRSGDFHGTPGYWPPEQARGELARIGPPADVYGLGATLWALLAGRPPFLGQDLFELVRAVGQDPPPSLRALRPEVDPTLERVLLRCLEKEPAARWPDAGALGRALEEWLAARPGAAARRAQRSALRLGLAILALGALRAGAVALARRPRAPAPASRGAGDPTTARGAPDAVAPPASGASALDGLGADFYQRTAREDPAVLLAEVERALSGAPPAAEARLRLRAALLHFARGDDERCLAEAERALSGSLEPLEQAVAEYLRGSVHLRAKRLAPAEAALDRALELEPVHGLALVDRAGLRAASGRAQPALEDLDLALAFGPGGEDVLRRAIALRAGLYVTLGREVEARHEVERAAALYPADDPQRVPLAALLQRLPPPRAVQGGPEVTAALTRAAELIQSGQAEAGRGELDALLQRSPDAAAALSARGKLLVEAGLVAEARADFDRALELAPGFSDARWGRVRVRARQGDLAGAAEDALWAVSLEREPDDTSWWIVGSSLDAAGRLGPAWRAYDRALERGTRGGELHYARGWVRFRLGDHAGAVEDLARALEQGYRAKGHTCLRRAAALEALRRPAEAAKDYRAAEAELAPGSKERDFVAERLRALEASAGR